MKYIINCHLKRDAGAAPLLRYVGEGGTLILDRSKAMVWSEDEALERIANYRRQYTAWNFALEASAG